MTARWPAEGELGVIRWRRAARRRRVRRRLSSASFARQKRAERPQVQIEVFDGETEVVPQLGHPGLEGHQSRSDLLDLIARERPLFHPAQGLTLHQLAQQFDQGENQGHQALLHRLRVGVDPEPAYRSALIRGDHVILAICHQLYSCESSMASIRPLIDVTSARSDTLTRSTSAMDKVMSPTMTTPPASTRSSRSTRAMRSPWITGSYPGPVTADLDHRPR